LHSNNIFFAVTTLLTLNYKHTLLSIKKDISARVHVVFFCMACVGILIILQALSVQRYEGEYLRKLSRNFTRIDTIHGDRGNVYAEKGELLATSLPVFEIRMDMTVPSEKIIRNELDSLAICLAEYFGDKSVQAYRSHLLDGIARKKAYWHIKSKVEYADIDTIRTFPVFKHGRYKGGLIIERKQERINPFGMLAKRTIGYKKVNAAVGIERNFNRYLKGSSQPRSMQRLSAQEWIPMYDLVADVKRGNDVHTTLDMHLQDIVEMALLNGLEQSKANYGCAIVMEVATGKIKAIANLNRKKDSTYAEIYNHAIGRKSEPGSTFKTVVVAALLEDGLVDLNTKVDVEKGQKYYHDRLMQDDKPWLEGTKLSLSEIIENSSNVGISKLINRHYGDKPLKFIQRLENFRLHKKTGIEISGEETPVIKRPTDKDWSGTTLPWMSIGYVIELTPLQLLCFYNAIANDGELMKPYLVNTVRNYNEVIKSYEPISMGQILTQETANTLQQVLGEVVNNGTARGIAIPEIPMAGKTGTSKIAKDKKGYQDKVYQASFAGFFPANNPQYSCIILVHEPSAQGKQYYGSVVAAPIFKEIVQKFYVGQVNLHTSTQVKLDSLPAHIPLSFHGYQNDVQTLYDEFDITTNQKRNTNWVIPTANQQSVQLSELKIINSLVPNVTGMGLRDAMYLLESHGLKVRFKGQGKVYKQYPTYGATYQQGNIVSLNLR